jgi:hypothetical protein
MLPLIDLCNHSFAPNCDIDKRQAGSIVLVAKRDVADGEELLLSYGHLDSHTLLLDYGFIVPDNPFDQISLAFDVEKLTVCSTNSTPTLIQLHSKNENNNYVVDFQYFVARLANASSFEGERLCLPVATM